jgi:hypothetical protein
LRASTIGGGRPPVALPLWLRDKLMISQGNKSTPDALSELAQIVEIG